LFGSELDSAPSQTPQIILKKQTGGGAYIGKRNKVANLQFNLPQNYGTRDES
jgi:hypothetical protein